MSDVRFMEYRSPGQFIGWPGSGVVGGGGRRIPPCQHPPICCSNQGPENLDMSCGESATRTGMTTASSRFLISSSFMKDILHKLQTLEWHDFAVHTAGL